MRKLLNTFKKTIELWEKSLKKQSSCMRVVETG